MAPRHVIDFFHKRTLVFLTLSIIIIIMGSIMLPWPGCCCIIMSMMMGSMSLLSPSLFIIMTYNKTNSILNLPNRIFEALTIINIMGSMGGCGGGAPPNPWLGSPLVNGPWAWETPTMARRTREETAITDFMLTRIEEGKSLKGEQVWSKSRKGFIYCTVIPDDDWLFQLFQVLKSLTSCNKGVCYSWCFVFVCFL